MTSVLWLTVQTQGRTTNNLGLPPIGSLLFGNTEHWLGDTGSSSLVVVSGGYGTSTQTHLDNMLASSQGDFKHH